MRRLSGWARLWIVGAVVMWSAGGWWLSQHWPHEARVDSSEWECTVEYLTYEDVRFPDYGRCRSQHSNQECQRLYDECVARAAPLIEQEQRLQAEYHAKYLRDVALGTVGVALSPALLAAALALIAWVLKGFRSANQDR